MYCMPGPKAENLRKKTSIMAQRLHASFKCGHQLLHHINTARRDRSELPSSDCGRPSLTPAMIGTFTSARACSQEASGLL